jgi:uncharacterized protein
MSNFRILSLDGGGSWALLQVMALQAIYSESAKGHDILKDFDLVAANSGGSITLGGLIENRTLKELLSVYFLDEAKRRTIFSPIGLFEDLGDKIFDIIQLAPRYSTAAKLDGLQSVLTNFGSTRVSLLPSRIVQSVGRSPHFMICAFDYDSRRATFFRSNTKSDAASSGPHVDPTLAEAINASSTAPVKFFDKPAGIDTNRYWDGAISGYNNPVLGAVVEALANNVAASDIRVLSIGTGSVRLPPRRAPTDPPGFTQAVQEPSVPGNLAELAGAIVDDPPDAASFIAHVALGQPVPDSNQPTVLAGNVVRISPMIQPMQGADETWGPPPGLSPQQFADLAVLEMDAVNQADVVKIQNLGFQWIVDKVPNQPIRSNSVNFHAEIGHDKFSEAKSKWNTIK